MRGKIEKILKYAGVKSIATLSSGVMIGQIITFIIQPFATRLFGEADFGILQVIISLSTMVIPIVTLQYHMAIVNAESDEECYALCKLSFISTFVLTVIFAVGLIVYNYFFPDKFRSAGNWIYASVLLILLGGIINIVDSYNNRFKEFKLMASVAAIRSALSGAVKIIWGLISPSFIGLLVGQMVSTIGGVGRQSHAMRAKKKEIINIPQKEVTYVAKKYRRQPLFSLPGTFFISYAFSIIPLLMSGFYSEEEIGFYSLSMIMLGLPLNLVSTNAARVFFQNASEEKQKTGCFRKSFISTTLLMSAISLAGFTVLYFIAEPAFGFVFGESWRRSGEFTKIMIPLFSVRFVVNSLTYGFIISGRQLIKTLIQASFVIEAVIIKMIAVSVNMSIETFLSCFNWMYCATYVLLLVILYFTSKKQETPVSQLEINKS